MQCGWALLGQLCPQCTTPLVRDKQLRMYCVKCQAWVVPESQLKPDGTPTAGATAPLSAAGPRPTPPDVAISVLRNDSSGETSSAPDSSADKPPANADISPVSSRQGGSSGGGGGGNTDDEWVHEEEHFVTPSTVINEEEKARQRRRDEVSKVLGQKLLLGWKMLEDLCPNDDCPLMQPKNGPPQCVACGAIVLDGQASSSPAMQARASPRQAPLPSDPALAAPPRSNPSSDSTFEAEEKRVQELLAARRKEREARIAELAQTPLSEDGEETVKPVSHQPASATPDVSDLISEKLLLGWALLEQCCSHHRDKCECPLVRDPKGVGHCVVCGARYSKAGKALENTAHAAAHPNHNKRQRTSDQEPQAQPLQPQQMDDEEDEHEEKQLPSQPLHESSPVWIGGPRQPTQRRPVEPSNAAAAERTHAEAPPAAAALSGPSEISNPFPSAVRHVFQAAQSSLLAQLSTCSAMMSSAQLIGPEACLQVGVLAETMAKLAGAVADIHRAGTAVQHTPY